MQRGRKGSKITAVPLHANAQSPRLTPPASLTNTEKSLFNRIVAQVDAKHFAPHQQSLVASYVKIILRLESLSDHAPPSEFTELVRLQFSAATRLRLTPQALVHKDTAGRLARDRQLNPLDEYFRNNGFEDDRTH